MKMELAQVVNKGMQRDYAMNTASQEFAYENKNIRITSTGNESFLSVTNEKSTTPIKLVFKDPTYRDVDLEKKLNIDLLSDNYQLCIVNVNKATKTRLHLQGVFQGENGTGIRFHNEIYEIDVDKSVYDEEHDLNLTKIDITEQRQDLKNKIASQYGVNRDEIAIDKGYLTIIEGYSAIYDSHDDVINAQNTLEILNCTTCNNYLVLFTSYKNIHNIYRCEMDEINLNYNYVYLNLVYTGNLNLKSDKPLECISYYESEDVQKIYWVDGVNQPRVINIMELGQTSNTSNLEFVPKIEKQPIVTIEKEQNGAGLFPSGVVQYYITYYKKFNQETHTAYTSPLYYISPDDRGGEADSIQTCSFRIRITDVDPKYDYVRVYSLVRTSKNSDYVVSIVGDINIKNSEDTYQIIDTNTNLVNVPSSDILFLGGNVIIPSTIEQKDNTLFLGNIITGTNTISDEITSLKKAFTTIRENNELSNLLKFVYKVVPVKNEDNTTLYPYNPNLESNLYDTHFKLREKYRVGIQLINDVGEGTQTIYVGDIINENHYPHYMSQDVMNDFSIDYENPIKVDNHYIDKEGNIHLYDILDTTVSYSDFLCLPIITFDFNSSFETIISNLKKKGFTNYKLVIAETDYKDRSILCQGYVNPLTFKLDRRKNNTCYSQESWTIRPMDIYKHLKNINKCTNNNYTKFSEIRGSLDDDTYKEDAMGSIDLDNDITIKYIELDAYCTNYNQWVSGTITRDHLLYYIIRVVGTVNGVIKEVSFRFDGDWSYNYANCYDWDIVHYFHTFDVWTTDKRNAINEAFETNDDVLNSLGFVVDTRIFGDNFLPSHQLTPDGYVVDYLYYSISKTINANVGSEYLDTTHGIKENFYLDASQASFNTPDLENIQSIIDSNPNLKCRIVGKINIDRVTTDYDVILEDIVDGDNSTEIYNFNFSKVLNSNEKAIGIKNFPAVWSSKDAKAYNLMLLEKEGSTITNKDSLDESSVTPTATLKSKIIGNLWYASKTDYEFHWRFSIKDDQNNIEYYPSKDFSTDVTDFETIVLNYTTNEEDRSWYSKLIYLDLDTLDKGICLWNTDKYVKDNLYLFDVDDIVYNKNWKWQRTQGSVTPFTNLDTIKNDMEQTAFISKQNQVSIKYKPTNTILMALKSSYSDIYCLPGYTNFDLQGSMYYLWENSKYTIKDELIDNLYISVLPQHIIESDTNENIIYIYKSEITSTGLSVKYDKNYYLETLSHGISVFKPYNHCVVRLLEFKEGAPDYDYQEDYYKFQIVNTDTSYSINVNINDNYVKFPLFKGKTFYKGKLFENKNKLIKRGVDWYLSYVNKFYLTSLSSTLRGDYFLPYNSYGNEEAFLLNTGFYPSKHINRYLPFNLNGLQGFDYPLTFNAGYNDYFNSIEGNGINNSLWVCELYKDFNDFEFLGGTSENAIELNTFIPASQVCPIGSTIYGLYGDTYFKRWDNLRVYPMNEEQTNGIVDVVSLMLETHVNLDGDTRSARKRLDITNMRPSNMEGKINPVYSQSNNVITSNVLDDKFNVSSHPLQYWWSLPKTNLSEIDNWTHVILTRVGELDGDKGPLNKIKRWNNYLFAFQDKGIAQINFNNQIVIGGQEGVPVEIANSGNVQGHYYITTNNGCKNKWSIVESPAGLYFIDSYNKSIMLLGEGLKSLSQVNLFQDWIEQNEHGNVWNILRREPAFKSFYDPIHSEVYFANGEHCLCYNELLQQFTSFYDYENLNYMVLLDGHIYGINRRYSSYDPVQFHKMFEGEDYCNLFGKQCEYYMQYKINKDPFVDKTWTNLEYRADIFNTGNIQSNKDYASDNIISNKTFDTLKVWNEYQNGELDLNTVRMNYLKDAKSRFRVWRTNIPRANKSETNKYGLDRIRNPWIMLELKKTEDTSKRMEFHDLVIKYVI